MSSGSVRSKEMVGTGRPVLGGFEGDGECCGGGGKGVGRGGGAYGRVGRWTQEKLRNQRGKCSD